MGKILLIGAGGFIGALLRYYVSGWAHQLAKDVGFPWGTLVVNLTGCLVIGVLSYLADVRGAFTPDTRAFVFIGIMGAYTTFSTFGNETMALLRDGETAPALANVGAHMALGLGAVWAGRALAGLIWR
ncbi:MAG TPA: fluoride efflux transporter CrcB [Anaerolineales bacterium]|nr:fluoride efflux transporter CrcB [Anaerolineales bacterium]